MGHVGLELATCALVHNILGHLIGAGPVKSGSACFGHDSPRGSVVAASPRVDFIQDQSTFLWSDATLSDSSDAFSVELTLNDCERFGSADDLARFFFVFWEFLSEQI